MSKLQLLLKKASVSEWYKWVLNRVLSRAIPFNAPHHFRVLNVKSGEIQIRLPYRRSNMNHVKGIHACALATLCEYTVGLTLISKISENEFRIILKNIRMEYHYQAKMDVTATFTLTDEFINEKLFGPLSVADSVFHEFEIKVVDSAQNHICTGFVNWQVKKWDKVGRK